MDLYGRLIRDVAYPTWEGLRGRPTADLMRYLDETQWLPLDALETIQTGLLRRLVRHCFTHVPYYRQLMQERGLHPEDFRSAADIAKLPVLPKERARETYEARMSEGGPPPAVTKGTGGTTGLPMTISYSAESRVWREATKWRGYGWAGYQPGAKSLHFWGFGAVPPKTRFAKYKIKFDRALKRELYLDCTPRSDEYLASVVAHIKEFRPEVILCYAQSGAGLARFINKMGARDWDTIPMITGAERLWPHDREAMQAAFGAVFETYGCREVMLMGTECSAHNGLHTSMENLIVEILVREPDGSTRAARPGETGEVCVTDLHNLSNPFVRYLNGDLATAMAPTRCACGRWLPRIESIQGRVTETLHDLQGNPVSGLIFHILLVDAVAYARHFQVVQHKDRRLTVKMVTNDGGPLAPEIETRIRGYIDKYMPGVPLAIDLVDDIPVTAAGKRRVVVVEQ